MHLYSAEHANRSDHTRAADYGTMRYDLACLICRKPLKINKHRYAIARSVHGELMDTIGRECFDLHRDKLLAPNARQES